MLTRPPAPGLALLAATLLHPMAAHAQRLVHGVVTDAETAVPVSDAMLRVFSPGDSSLLSAIATARSNGAGRFVLDVPRTRAATIVVVRLGFHPDTLRFQERFPDQLTIRLRPGGVVLPEITVLTSAGPQAREPVLSRTRQELHATPAAAGIDDPVRALGFEPGVMLASPYSARLSVRGSSPDQLGFFLDGFPVLNPVQLGGMFSGVPAAAVSSLTLWGINTPASLSGTSGGALDARTLPTAGSGFSGTGTVNVMATELALRWSPSTKVRTAVAGRHSWVPRVLEDRTGRDAFSLSDYVASAEFRLGRRVRIFGTAYTSAEQRGDSNFAAGTQRRVGHFERSGRTLGAGLSFTGANGLSAEARVWDARASSFGEHLELFNLEAQDSSTMESRGVGATLRGLLGGVRAEGGITLTNLAATSDVQYSSFLARTDAGRLRSDHDRTQVRAHVGATGNLNDRLQLSADAALLASAGAVRPEPSLSLAYEASPRWHLTASVATRHQLLYQMVDPRSRSDNSFSIVDAWMVAGDSLDPGTSVPHSTEIVANAEWRASDRLALTGSLYRRTGSGHPVLDVFGFVIAGAPSVGEAGESASGLSLGAKLALPGAMLARVSYSWTRSRLTTERATFPTDFDIPQRFTFFLGRQPSRGFRLSVAGTLQSGQPYTSPEWGYQTAPWDPVYGNSTDPTEIAGILLFTHPNNARTRFSHRVDVEIGMAGEMWGMPFELFAAALNVTQGISVPPRILGAQGGGISRAREYAVPPVPLIGLRLEF
jgi:hypothetical protein